MSIVGPSYSNPLDGYALVIGVSKPAEDKKVTTVSMHGTPDIQGDIMKIPNETLGENKYSRIVFQGVCPVNTAMGASQCGPAATSYESIDVRKLANKIRGLIARDGGYVFCRLCYYAAFSDKEFDPRKRENFIKSFIDAGFEQVERTHPPLTLAQKTPGDDIPEDSPIHSGLSIGDKIQVNQDSWDPEYGALVFFLPGLIS